MEVKHRFIMKRIDGVPVNLSYEPVKSLSTAARFNDLEAYERFITGHYKPSDAAMYRPQKIKITYEEEEDNADQES